MQQCEQRYDARQQGTCGYATAIGCSAGPAARGYDPCASSGIGSCKEDTLSRFIMMPAAVIAAVMSAPTGSPIASAMIGPMFVNAENATAKPYSSTGHKHSRQHEPQTSLGSYQLQVSHTAHLSRQHSWQNCSKLPKSDCCTASSPPVSCE